MGAVGLLLLVASIDIIWTHTVSLDPEIDTAGERTQRGEARFRQDILVGTTFLLSGGALMAVALRGLVNPRPTCEISERGITLRIAGPQSAITLGWHDVLAVRSGREPNDSKRTRPTLLVLLRDPERWPTEYWGARREGSWLLVNAGSWDTDPEELSLHAGLARNFFTSASSRAAIQTSNDEPAV